MAQFMHDDVVLQVRRQKEHFVAEIEVLKRRAAPPRPLRIADRNALILEAIELIPVRKFFMNEYPSPLFMCEIVLGDTCPPPSSHSPSHSDVTVYQKTAGRACALLVYCDLNQDTQMLPILLHLLHPHRAHL